MEQLPTNHFFPESGLSLTRAFLTGESIRTATGIQINNAGASFGKIYLEAFPEYVHNTAAHQKKVDTMMDLLHVLELQPAPDTNVAVIGSGHGTHDLFLAQRYKLHVHGVDICQEAIDIARNRAKHTHQPLYYYQADVTNGLPFDKNSMQAIFCLGTSWGFDPDDQRNQAVFAHIFDILQAGGVFVLDYVNGKAWGSAARTYHKDITILANGTTRTKEEMYFPEVATNITKITLERPDQEKQFCYEHLKYYTLEQVTSMLTATNLTVKGIYGDMDGQTFDAATSSQMVIIATKGNMISNDSTPSKHPMT